MALAQLNEALQANPGAKEEADKLVQLWPSIDTPPFGELHGAAKLRGVVDATARLCHEGKIRPKLQGPDLNGKFERISERLSAFGTFCRVKSDGQIFGQREVQMQSDSPYRIPLVTAAVRGMFASHPNIVPTLALRVEPSTITYLAPYSDLGSLGSFLSKALLSPELQQKFIGELIDGLVYLHSCGWVHGNLKPSNVLVSLDADKVYTVQLGDMGVASPALTMGSVEYMAPELLVLVKDSAKDRDKDKDKTHEKDKLLALWKAVTRASDVYAFGILTWLITHHGKRKPPFKETTAPDVAKCVLAEKRPKTDSSVTDKGTMRLMQKCWDPKPNKRPDIRVMMQLFYEGTTRRSIAGNAPSRGSTKDLLGSKDGSASPGPVRSGSPAKPPASSAVVVESRGRSRTEFLAALLDELDELAEREDDDRKKEKGHAKQPSTSNTPPGFLSGPVKPEQEKAKREAEGTAVAKERLTRLLEATRAKNIPPEKVLLVLKQAHAKNEHDPFYSKVLEEEIDRREQP